MKKYKWYFIFIGSFFSIFILVGIWIYFIIPSRADLMGCMITKMYHVDLCPGSNSYVPLSKISRYLQKSIIVSEDSRFYEHKGFDWESIEKSAKENLQKGKIKRGGSTITQQLAKNLYLSKEKSIFRKLVEAFITIQIEKNLTKKEILEKYLNVIEYGKNIFGIKAAAKFYFSKSPIELDVVESAFLTMLLPNPVKYSRSFHKKELTPFAFKRINRIINDLYQYNRINEDEYNQAVYRLKTFFTQDNYTIDEIDQNTATDEDSDADSQEDASADDSDDTDDEL